MQGTCCPVPATPEMEGEGSRFKANPGKVITKPYLRNKLKQKDCPWAQTPVPQKKKKMKKDWDLA
jgi:hypothetical protein